MRLMRGIFIAACYICHFRQLVTGIIIAFCITIVKHGDLYTEAVAVHSTNRFRCCAGHTGCDREQKRVGSSLTAGAGGQTRTAL